LVEDHTEGWHCATEGEDRKHSGWREVSQYAQHCGDEDDRGRTQRGRCHESWRLEDPQHLRALSRHAERAQQDAARKMEARKLSYGIGYGAQGMVQNDEEGIPATVSPSRLPS